MKIILRVALALAVLIGALSNLVRSAKVLCWISSLRFLILAEFCEDCEVFERRGVADGVAAGGDVAE